MSKHSMRSIDCPQCKHEQNFMMWESLNGDLDPEAKQRLLNGTFFQYKCEKCGYEANVNYDILYHDMKHHTMVYMVDQSVVEETRKYMEMAHNEFSGGAFADPFGMSAPKTRNRIVTDQNRLREKAIIFDADLDDRVVEIIKMMCWIEVVKSVNDVKDNELYFYINDGEFKVEVVGRGIICNVTREMYDNIAAQFKPMFDVIGDDEYVVDNNFAGNVMVALNTMNAMARSDDGDQEE